LANPPHGGCVPWYRRRNRRCPLACAVDAHVDILGLESATLPPPRQEGAERISVDGTSGTLLLIDAAGRPCTPGLMYNDARATTEAARIAAIAPAESGAHGTSSALAKLLHLLGRAEARSARFAIHQADWIAGGGHLSHREK
jgi:D-ribulokinase